MILHSPMQAKPADSSIGWLNSLNNESRTPQNQKSKTIDVKNPTNTSGIKLQAKLTQSSIDAKPLPQPKPQTNQILAYDDIPIMSLSRISNTQAPASGGHNQSGYSL
jgi:hypothetical protein